jgi:phospholipase/lecithinase/hemolysin
MQRYGALLLTVISLFASVSSAHADPINQIVVFGDSLSDVGNTYIAAGIPPAPYYQGHYSNGPIWLEQLATKLGITAPTASLAGGTDYAFGGAETGTGVSPKGVPNMLTQVGQYLGAHTPRSGQLFVLWGAANNFFNGQTNPVVPVMDIGHAITELAAAGAKNFLVPNYPNLALTPFGRSSSPAVQQGLAALTQGYNQVLKAELATLQGSLGVHITQLNNYGLFQTMIGNPGGYGFTNVMTGAVGDQNFSATGYLFWDDVHPTTAGHRFIADAAYAAIAPEPTSLALVSTGALGLAVAAFRRRFARRKGLAVLALLLLTVIALTAPAAARAQANSEQYISSTPSPMIPDPDRFPAASPSAAATPATDTRAATPVPAAELWRLMQESKFDATWLPGSGAKRLEIGDLEITTILNVPTVEGWAPLMITPCAAAHEWMVPSGVTPAPVGGLPSHLYDLNVEFGWRPRLAKWLFIDLAVTPGLYTDFKDVNSDSFRMRGRALAIVAFSPQFQIVGGVMYVNRNLIKLLPAGGIIWIPSDDFRCFLVFPQPKVSYRFAKLCNSEFWGYVAGEFGGGRWEIERADSKPDSIDYTDIRALLGVECYSGSRLKEDVEVGYVFARKVNVTDGAPDYRPEATVMLRAGVRY